MLNRFKLAQSERAVSADRVREVCDRDFDSASEYLDRIIYFSRCFWSVRHFNCATGLHLSRARFLGLAMRQCAFGFFNLALCQL
ncbi:hypothetical protein PSTH1771_13650 [Pseudomonas syringae pv. theae]|nr:hypothetical protein PSTH1771_13650 [Pseudomonas syringae pv. theae]